MGDESKAQIRQKCLCALKSMSSQQRETEQKDIDEQAFAIIKKRGFVVSIYVSQSWEVATLALIDRGLELGLLVCCPKVFGLGEMRHFQIESRSDLKASKVGILEPKVEAERFIDPMDIDLVFVPGLGFTPKGDRLGYGGGYYDRFLSQTNGYKIGLSFRNQLMPSLPVETHDVQLNCVLSPKSSF